MTDGHIRVGNTHWHGIVADDSPPCETLRVCFYFTDLNEENGCVRPPTHMLVVSVRHTVACLHRSS